MFTRDIPRTKRNERIMKEMLSMAEGYRNSAPLSLPYTLFELFEKQGTRLEYEEAYSEHRRRLTSVFFSYLWTDDEKWLPTLFDAIWAVLDEYTWAFPAHVTREKVGSVYGTVRAVDLFSAETVYALAEIDSILGDTLPPLIRERIRYEAKRRVVDPVIEKKQTYPRSNWAAVQGAGIIACITRLFPELLDDVKGELVRILTRFLDSYDSDGCCMEGSLYWLYGFGFFIYGADMLLEATKGEIDLLGGDKVKSIARFRENCIFKDSFVIPFADAPLNCKMRYGLSSYLHKKFGTVAEADGNCMDFLDDQRFRFADIIHDLYWGDESLCAGERSSSESEYYYPDAQWYINKNESIYFAAKGGYNNEPHNHNDVGAYALFDGVDTVLGDIGWEDYDRTYFGPTRYTHHFLTASRGHSLPIIEGKEQITGEKRAEVYVSSGGAFSLNMKNAYEGDMGDIIRIFKVEKDTLTVTDEFSEIHTAVFRTVSTKPFEITDKGIASGGFLINATCDSAYEIKLSGKEYKPRRLICGDDLREYETAYILDLVPETPVKCFEISIKKATS